MQLNKGILTGAKIVPSPNKSGPITPSAIIVHDTAGALSKGSSVNWLTNPEARASAHFVVERDGSITQLVNTNLKAWHAGKSELNGRTNVNAFSIGIEIVNPGLLQPHGASGARAHFGTVYDRKKYGIEERDEQYFPLQKQLNQRSHPAGLWMPYTEAQIEAVLQLCLAINKAYTITELRPHWYISPGRKIDTNPLFPLAWLAGRITGRADEPEPEPAAPLTINRGEVDKGEKGNPEPTPELCTLKPAARLHKWPSFVPDHEVERHADKRYIILDNGMFNIAGDFMPDELVNEQLHWVKLKHDSAGEVWTLFSNIIRA